MTIRVRVLRHLPALRQLADGQFAVTCGRRGHRLGHDPAAAIGAYADILIRSLTKTPTSAPNDTPRAARPTVRAVAERVTGLAASPTAARNFRTRIEPFLKLHGHRPIDTLTDDDFASFRTRLATRMSTRRGGTRKITGTYANNMLQVVRRLLTKAFQLGLLEHPYRLLLLGDLPAELPPRKGKPVWFIQELIEQVATIHPVLAKTLLLQFYGTMRPEENARILRGEGVEIEPGVIALNVAKTVKSLKEPRHILLSDDAMKLRAELVGRWGEAMTSSSIRQACRALQLRHFAELKFSPRFREMAKATDFQFSPHFFRHSSAQALAEAGVAVEHIQMALGRRTNKVDRVYFLSFKASRDAVGVLATIMPQPVYGPERPAWFAENGRRMRKAKGVRRDP